MQELKKEHMRVYLNFFVDIEAIKYKKKVVENNENMRIFGSYSQW